MLLISPSTCCHHLSYAHFFISYSNFLFALLFQQGTNHGFAFDTVNHQILLSTFQELGISGSVLSLFASYRKERTYRVIWRESVSELCSLTTRVSRFCSGSPRLFSLHQVTQLCYPLTRLFLLQLCRWHLFCLFPCPKPRWQLWISACLADISEWMSADHLKLNLDQTKLLFLPGKASPIHDLSINIENSMSPARITRNLGVTLDDKLSLT